MAQQTRRGGSIVGAAGRRWAIAGIISGLLTLVWSPLIFALLGVVLGYVGRSRGSERLGGAAIAISVSLFVLIFVINAVIGGLGAVV